MNNNYEKTITTYYKKLEIYYWKIGKFLLNLN